MHPMLKTFKLLFGAGGGIRTHETITVTDLAGLRPTRLGDPGVQYFLYP